MFGVNTHMEWKNMKNSKGFTLIEVIIVVAIIGIIAAISIPSMSGWLSNYRLKAAAREIYGQFQRAKMEAIKRNQPVAIVFDTTGTDQYQVFVDLNNNKSLETGAGEQLLAKNVMKNGIVLSAITFTANSTGFTPRGLVSGGSGSVTISSPTGSRNFTLTTSISGYVHLQ